MTPFDSYRSFLISHRASPGSPCNHTNLTGHYGGRFFIPPTSLPTFFKVQAGISPKYRTVSQLLPSRDDFSTVFLCFFDIESKGDDISDKAIDGFKALASLQLERMFKFPKGFEIQYRQVRNDTFNYKIHIHSNIPIIKRDYLRLIHALKTSPLPKDFKPEFLDCPAGLRLYGNYKSKDEDKTDENGETKSRKIADSSKGVYRVNQKITAEELSLYSIYSSDPAVKTLPLTSEYSKSFENEEKEARELKPKRKELGKINRTKIVLVLEKLSMDYCDDFHKWSMMCKTLVNLGFEKEDIITYSENSDKYDSEAETMIEKWVDDFDESHPYGCTKKYPEGLGQGILFSALKASVSEEEYISVMNDMEIHQSRLEKYFYGGEKGMGRILFDLNHKDIKLTAESRKDPVCGYQWEEEVKLWVPQTREHFTVVFGDQLERLASELKQKYYVLSIRDSDSDMKEVWDTKSDYFKKKLHGIQSRSMQTSCLQFGFDFLQDKKLLNSDLNFKHSLNVISDWLPITNNKVINVTTREIRERTREDMFSYSLNVSYVKRYDRAIRYIMDLSKDELEVALSLLSWMGYSITSLNRLKLIAVYIGIKDTGKSGLMRLFKAIFKHQIATVSDRVIIETRSESTHSTEWVPLKTTRIAVINELKETDRINGSNVKKIVGGDVISKRTLFEEEKEFTVRSKLIVLSNVIPEIPNEPDLLCKIVFYQFKNSFPLSDFIDRMEKDQSFLDELFSLIVDSCVEYTNNGFYQCEQVKAFSKEKREESDNVLKWLTSTCEQGDGFVYPSANARTDYQSWCSGDVKYRKKEFTDGMALRFVFKEKTKIQYPRKAGVFERSCFLGVRPKFEPEGEYSEPDCRPVLVSEK